MIWKMLDLETKNKVRNILCELNKKFLLLEGEGCPEERRLIIDSMILSDSNDSELNQLKKLLGIGE